MKIQSITTQAWSALRTLLLVGGLAVLVFVLCLSGILIQSQTVSIHACQNNLRQIEGAAAQYALEYKIPDGKTIYLTNIVEYLRQGVPGCPVGGMYPQTLVSGQPATCTLLSTNAVLHEKLDREQSGVFLRWPVRMRLPF